jgi:hypothetical protein
MRHGQSSKLFVVQWTPDYVCRARASSRRRYRRCTSSFRSATRDEQRAEVEGTLGACETSWTRKAGRSDDQKQQGQGAHDSPPAAAASRFASARRDRVAESR